MSIDAALQIDDAVMDSNMSLDFVLHQFCVLLHILVRSVTVDQRPDKMAEEDNGGLNCTNDQVSKKGTLVGCSTLLRGFPLDDKGFFHFDKGRPPKYMDIRRFIVSRSGNPVYHNRSV